MKKDEKQLVALLTNPATRERAFAELVKQYSQPLYWQIRRLVLSHDNADDVLQNTFVKAWMNIDSFQGKSQLSTWMYRIAINESIDFLRRQRNVSTLDIDDAPNVANQLMSDDYFDGDEAQAMLQQAIAKLPEVQRTVFNLRYYDDMKYSEISKILNTSVGALKASYHIAVKKIKEELDK
ncbi:MAG: sigma-70 family RNA polymerase sigma factor [Prevotella sp.]|nr:sigma-70 family RNA polymerase sigma factor [Prevotella sp.]